VAGGPGRCWLRWVASDFQANDLKDNIDPVGGGAILAARAGLPYKGDMSNPSTSRGGGSKPPRREARTTSSRADRPGPPIKRLGLSELHFDGENPRFGGKKLRGDEVAVLD